MPATLHLPERSERFGEAALRYALVALALAVAGAGTVAVWRYGWRDLFADAWRIYANYLAVGFPRNVVALENGHRPLVPALLRVAELHWFAADQRLQWIAGLGLAVGSVLAGWWIVLRDRAVDPLARAASTLAVAVAVFWLANARMLMHPTESVQTYLVLLMLVVGALCAARIVGTPAPPTGRALAACIGCAFVATFAFGTGLVVFPALAVTLLAARAPIRTVVALLAAMLATLVLYVALPGGGHVTGLIVLDPWRNLQVAAQWLAAPVATLLAKPLDPGSSALLPLVPRIAPSGETPPPATWIGLAAMATLIVATLRRWLRGGVGPTEVLGLALGWFAFGAALIVGLTRLTYFEVHPAQLFAARYLPWPCLLWAALALLALGAAREPDTWRLRVAVIVVAAVGIAALRQGPDFARWSRAVQAHNRHHAVAVLADLWSTPRMQGETVTADVAAAVPGLRAQRLALFAHPAAMRLGTELREAPPSTASAREPARAEPYRSDAGIAAIDFDVTLPDGYAPRRTAMWLVTDARNVVVGYAHPMPLTSRRNLAGVARRPDADGVLTAVPWTDGAPGAGFRFVVPPAARGGAVAPS